MNIVNSWVKIMQRLSSKIRRMERRLTAFYTDFLWSHRLFKSINYDTQKVNLCSAAINTLILTHLYIEHRCPRGRSVGGVCGSLSECCPACLPPLAGYGEALWRSTCPLRVGDTVCHCHSLHLHWRTCHYVGTGETEAKINWNDEFYFDELFLSAVEV